jgi:hypothetical protein
LLQKGHAHVSFAQLFVDLIIIDMDTPSLAEQMILQLYAAVVTTDGDHD